MRWVELAFIILSGLAGAVSFGYVLWTRRLGHIWPKRNEIEIINKKGLFTGIAEVALQTRVIANRPMVGTIHLVVFYGFVSFGIKSVTHVAAGVMGLNEPIHLGPIDVFLDVICVLVLTACVLLAIRRYFFMRDRLTHPVESGIVLSLIAGLMVTYMLERPTFGVNLGLEGTAAKVNWWVHYLILCGFPALIAYGKHLHLMMAPLNVVLKHMTEVPSDRPISGGDFEMPEDEDLFEAEYARVGMPNGVADFSFHSLFDTTACIECGRCNDACPSAGAGLQPRDHFVLSLRDPTVDSEGLAELIPPDILATCTQCRACDVVCPVGNRPSKAGLEIRGRMSFEGLYPVPGLTDGASPAIATGNLFGEGPETRAALVRDQELPIYDHEQHDVLFILGCQGANSPDLQPIIGATARLLEAAGVKYGVPATESCWGEALVHGGGLMEDWPFWKLERAEELDTALGGDRTRTILTICPHCKDSIGTQYADAGHVFPSVRSHVDFLAELVRDGRLTVEKKTESMAVHHPCKIIHNDETALMDQLLEVSGVTAFTAGKSPNIPSCCGGGGGGFLWDSPAKVNRKRMDEIAATGQTKTVTSCPGCHRMLDVAKSEDAEITDIANVLYERVHAARAKKRAAEAPEAAAPAAEPTPPAK
ncbi:MAG: (Fe-S)-binding protein [Myxococcota bacterium]|nr:(Fe-S)-binding protein [Myxococcota bacterium]